MKDDLDRLMQEQGLDALLVSGPATHNAPLVYFLGAVNVTHADLLKKRGEPPVVYHSGMEREEAARSGLKTVDREQHGWTKLLEQANGKETAARGAWLAAVLREQGVRGRLGIHGRVDAGYLHGVLRSLQERMPDIEIVGESIMDSALGRARATKDAAEVERIRRSGKIATAVMAEVATLLTSHPARDGVLVTRDGDPLTVGEVKRRMNLWLAMRGGETPETTIFAIGRDAGIPHSTGNDRDRLELGKPIIFDFFPCEAGGGYFYDITRTWCLGHAPDDVQSIYQDVLEAHQRALQALRAGRLCRELQLQTCEFFESRGHPTVHSDPLTEVGYVHGLGHGLGLSVHEPPGFRDSESNTDRLEPGMVVTVEPGLYYPEKGIGVRLEDTVWIPPEGAAEVLAPLSMDLVLPIQRA